MKKTYQAPKAQNIVFDAMTMLATSPGVNIDPSKEIDASGAFSNAKGWDSANWSATDNEE